LFGGLIEATGFGMTLSTFTDSTCGFPPDSNEDFRIAILYDTLENGLAAMKIGHRIVAEFGSEFLFHIALCDFAAIETGRPGPAQSLLAARRAQLVLVSARGPLPESVREWLHEWAVQAQAGPVALALMVGDPSSHASTVERIRELCLARGIDFFTSACARPAARLELPPRLRG